ncbi:hypothetical protein ACS8Y6_06050 [Salinisphaera sp. RV14]|uniref:hypothetical protein n=1 Tax=unclassified Salinisphaera TaxID=2649847 RepID=UPI003F85D494
MGGVFDATVSLRVLFYHEIQRMQSERAGSLPSDGDRRVYDPGCSAATTRAALVGQAGCPPGVCFVAIDNGPDMHRPGATDDRSARCG